MPEPAGTFEALALELGRALIPLQARLGEGQVKELFAELGLAIPYATPTHVPGSVREIQLQRSRMPRILPGAPLPPPKVPPRTTLIREGLDVSPARPYFIHEEEVPRAGAQVTLSFRRTRWTGGQAPVWLGVRKRTGRGERGSGLAFDVIANAPPKQR